MDIRDSLTQLRTGHVVSRVSLLVFGKARIVNDEYNLSICFIAKKLIFLFFYFMRTINLASNIYVCVNYY